MASETLGQALSYINELLPNRMNSTTIVTLINNEMRKLWGHMTSTTYYELNTVSSQALYSLPTDCDFDRIVESGVLVADSTLAVTSTTVFTPYTYCGPDEQLIGSQFYEGVGGTFGLYPVPTYSGYPVRIKYQERPDLFASSDTSVQFPLDQDYVDVIKFKVMSRVCKAGNNPDVELGNNYEMDAMELERKLKLKRANVRMKTPRKRFSYKLDWDK